VVGLRLHSLILASIQGTPFTSIDYDIKIRGFMENMRSLNYLIQHNKGINRLVEKNRIALDNSREYTDSIGENVDKIKERINADSDILISSLLRENK
jgi:polysaccharide pyruvyl transferase WcaK-like protein